MKTSLLSNNERHILPIWTPLMSEATCGGAQRNHTSVAGGDATEGQKLLKSKGLSRRQVPLKSRDSPVRVNHTSVAGGEFSERQKSLKSKGLSRRQIPLQSREPPGRIGPGTPCLTKAPNLSSIFCFIKASHFCVLTPGDRGPATQDDATAAPPLINNFRSTTPLPLMSEATCGGAQRNHTSVAGGDATESQKLLKSKGLSRRQVPLQSRESPGRIGPGAPCLTKAPNLSSIFCFIKASHFCVLTPGNRGPATQDDATAAPPLINNFRSTTPLPLPLMSEATCGGAQRNHTSVAGGESSEGQKSLKSKGLSRRQVPLKSRESPGRIGPGAPCLTKAPNLSSIFCFIKASHFCVLTPGDRGPASHRPGDSLLDEGS